MDFIRYVRRVFVHWGALVTGGVGIGLLSTYQGVGHLVSPIVYWCIAGGAIFWGGFLAWRDEFRKSQKFEAELLALRSNSPVPAVQNVYLPAHPTPLPVPEPPKHNVQCLGVEVEDISVIITFQNVPIPGQPIGEFKYARLCIEYMDGLTGMLMVTVFPARWIEETIDNSIDITPRRAFLATFYGATSGKWRALPEVEGVSGLSYQERVDGLALPSGRLFVKATLVGERNLTLAPVVGFLTLHDDGQASWKPSTL